MISEGAFFFMHLGFHENFICLFVSRVGLLLCLMNQIRICRVPRVLMRHEAIEMVCAHVSQGREPPPHHSDVTAILREAIRPF